MTSSLVLICMFSNNNFTLTDTKFIKTFSVRLDPLLFLMNLLNTNKIKLFLIFFNLPTASLTYTVCIGR